MRRVRALLSRIGWLAHRRRLEADLNDELRSVLECEVEANVRRGMSEEEARRQALIRIGGLEQIKESYRERAGLPGIEAFWMDLRHAFRLLRKNPAYTAAAIVTLALGIGANTIMFSIVNAVLLKPLPYPGAERMVVIRETLSTGLRTNVSWPDFLDWRAQSRTLRDLAAVQHWPAKVGYRHSAVVASSEWTTTSYFRLLGRSASLGRVFGEADDKPGAMATAVLSHGFWLKNFGGDAHIVGRTIEVDEQPVAVIGVLRPSRETAWSDGDIFLPIGLKAQHPEMTPRSNHPGIIALGRLGQGATPASVRSEFATIMARLGKQYPESNRGETADIKPLQDDLLHGLKQRLLILVYAVGFVLLLACANVAHLALGRATVRKREFAMRAAVGASGGRLLKQVLTESLLLAMLGSGVALLIAKAGVPALARMYGDRVPGLELAHTEGTVLAFTLLLSVVATALFGSAPALIASRTDPNPALKTNALSLSARWNWRGVLIGAEVAIAFVLCVASVLLVESLRAVLYVDPGFQPEGLVMADILRTRPMGPETARFFNDVVEAVRREPGVESASAALSGPFEGTFWTSPFDPHGRSFSAAGTHPWTMLNMVLPGYFETVKTRIIAGRTFTKRDTASGPAVAVVSESAARMIDARGNVLGREVFAAYSQHSELRVIGVVADIKQTTLDQGTIPVIYVPEEQMPANMMTVVVRMHGGEAAEAILKRAIRSVDPEQPISRIAFAGDLLTGGIRERRFVTALLGAFALLGLLLAMTGVAGVVSYAVARRSREIGIRLAIGARPLETLAMIVKQAMLPACCGIAGGCILAWSLTRLLASMLFGVTPHDPVTFLSATVALSSAALVASLIPARRALRIDAIDSLRAE
ncbi:MAG: ABC transporter permease [Acidobacteriaceae bacterium]|nr:ABC transporter permease [Acidobacteriaceae bacterium]